MRKKLPVRVRKASKFSYGYQRRHRILADEGRRMNVSRFIWRLEGAEVPSKQPKRSRLLLNDGSSVRLPAERPSHVWSHDLVQDRTADGRTFGRGQRVHAALPSDHAGAAATAGLLLRCLMSC